MSEFHNRGYPSSVPFGELGRIPVHVPRGSLNLPDPSVDASREDVASFNASAEETLRSAQETTPEDLSNQGDWLTVRRSRPPHQRHGSVTGQPAPPRFRRVSIIPNYDEIADFAIGASKVADALGHRIADSDYVQGYRGFFGEDYLELPESAPHETAFRLYSDPDGGIAVDWRSAADHDAQIATSFAANEEMTASGIRNFVRTITNPKALYTEAGVVTAAMLTDMPALDLAGGTALFYLATGVLARRSRHATLQRVAQPESTQSIMDRALRGDRGLYIRPATYTFPVDDITSGAPDTYPAVFGDPIATGEVIRQWGLLDDLANAKTDNGDDKLLSLRTIESDESRKRTKFRPNIAIARMLQELHADETDEFIANTYPDFVNLHYAQQQCAAAYGAFQRLDEIGFVPESTSPEPGADIDTSDLHARAKELDDAMTIAGTEILSSTLAIGAKWIDHYVDTALRKISKPL